jgi:hypothetical protein
MTSLDAPAVMLDDRESPYRTFLCALRAERLKAPTRLIWGMVIGTVVGSALIGFLFPGILPMHSEFASADATALENGASALPFSVDEFAEAGGVWAIQRFLSPLVGVVALCLAVAMTSRDLRSRVLLMQMTYGPSPLALTSATWLVAVWRWAKLSAVALLAGAVATGSAVLIRGAPLDRWFTTDVLTAGLRGWIALVIIGGFYSALGQVGAYLLRSSVLSLSIPLIYLLMIEPVLAMTPVKGWMLPGSYVKQIGWVHAGSVTGLPGYAVVIVVLAVTVALIAAAPAVLRRRVLS